MSFRQNLKMGRLGESLIAKWFNRRGFTVLPVYEIEINTGKGPQLFTPAQQLIAPDIFIFRADDCYWIEAKHKTAFSWHRISSQWVTGIDLRHYQDYCKVDEVTPWPVWLLFLHKGGQAKDSPPNSPAGLFGNTLEHLREHENHRSEKWGHSGMVYWSINDLKLLADLEELAWD